MIIVPFKAEHLDRLDVQAAQRHIIEMDIQTRYQVLENQYAYSGFVGSECVICAGLAEVWPGRAQGWSVISRNAGPHMGRITRAARRMLNMAPWRRIEVTVDCDFAAGHRWADVLGFKREAECMAAYLPNGRDAALYARVR